MYYLKTGGKRVRNGLKTGFRAKVQNFEVFNSGKKPVDKSRV